MDLVRTQLAYVFLPRNAVAGEAHPSQDTALMTPTTSNAARLIVAVARTATAAGQAIALAGVLLQVKSRISDLREMLC